ncbi:MAG: TIGR02452 family protein [Lachnospiraceae bacterium]|nr:TIGR02452 family protein [Lachnospiraceae bacterium]
MWKDRRTSNVEIFEDTEKKCCTNELLKAAIQNSLSNQKIYKEQEKVRETTGQSYVTTEIKVSGKRSLEAAKEYKGKKVCVHNFASATNPGGGVTRGSSAQEECLCRCSTLYFNLNTSSCWNDFYKPHRALNNPVYNDDCIYTPEVVVFKSDAAVPELLPEKEWYKVDVITAAAPNLRERPSNAMNPAAGNKKAVVSRKELLELHLKRGRRILDIARENGNEVVILGAFGCGAFQNPPEVVAECYKQLMKEYAGVFETVEFAVYCSERDRTNYEVFQNVLQKID